MTTILVLLLCYVVAATVFVRWMKTHAPDGYETEEQGFVLAARVPVAEIDRIEVSRKTDTGSVWTASRPKPVQLEGSVRAG